MPPEGGHHAASESGVERTIVRRTDLASQTADHRRTTASTSPTTALRCAVLVAMLTLAPSALGQIVRMNPETPNSVTLSPAQEDEIEGFLDEHADVALGEDPAAAARAIDDLIDPLLGEGVSVAFRQAYASRIIDRLRDAIADDRVMLENDQGSRSINHRPYHALRLAGELATDTTLDLIVEELRSEDNGRRYFAIHSIETVLFRMRTSAPAITARNLFNPRQGTEGTGLIPDMGTMLVEEKSSMHASAIARALAEAAELPGDVAPGVSQVAKRLIAHGAASRIRATAGQKPAREDALSWLTAGQRVIRVIAQPGSADGATSLAAIRLGGQLIASVYDDVEAGRAPSAGSRKIDELGKIHAQMLSTAESLLLFGEQNAATASGRRQNADLVATAGRLKEAYLSGNDSEFRRAALGLISPNGMLTAPPFGFDDDEFIVE